ncbi:MAG: HAD hydrolase family protein [Proteobacteria bacterium]|nr:HAD hydrolase family protein [Pseudomonadota bacterium]
MISQDIKKQIHVIKMLLLDVDGVLTRGSIIYTDKAEEVKIFSVKDGLGLRLLMDAGIQVGIVTGRTSKALLTRCDNLGITLIFDGIHHKEDVLDTIIQKTGLGYHEIAFAGDDLPDIRIMKKTGFPIAVANACPEVRSAASYITSAQGGDGAVREISELILKTQGLWDKAIHQFL